MPELPEVETVVRTLEKQLGNSKITAVDIIYPRIIEFPNVEEFKSNLIGQKFKNYKRLGKYLVFELNDYYLIAHLRMEGKFYVQRPEEPYDKHVHIIFSLDNGYELRYHDVRKFGRMCLYKKQDNFSTYPCFKNVGYDAFDERVTAVYLKNIGDHKKYTLKQFLLDQSNIAGIGNIYADEICFSIGLHPETKINHLDLDEYQDIIDNTRRILNGAIKAGGTTIRSYTSSLGVDGRFQLQLKVHQREGQKCPVCGTTINKIKVGGRGTYYCEKCQKIK